jgi:glycerophosphoryl diester phosphodiesterase
VSQPYLQRVAHRGGAALAPENTLAAFRNALTLSVDAIELDVQMSRDGHAIVFHDNTVDRLTNGTGNILDLDFSYLRSLNAAAHFAGGWSETQQIPTPDEVLTLAKGRIQVYIEIKMSQRGRQYGRYPHIVETVIEVVRAHDMLNDVLIMSFDWAILPLVKAIEPAAQTGALVSSEEWKAEDACRDAPNAIYTLLEQIKPLGCNWINMDRSLFTPKLADQLHEQCLKIGFWTVNSLPEMRLFAASGADSITSDRPDLLASI